MSEENVEIVRTAFDALSRGDIDAAMKNVSPDAEYDVSRALGPVHGIFRGRDEIRKSWEEFSEPWESQRWEADEFIEHGEHVATPMTNTLRGRDGIEVQARVAFLWTIRDGMVIRACFYQERHEALKAAGLSE
jgi:ketosteroid isomerase-like protein